MELSDMTGKLFVLDGRAEYTLPQTNMWEDSIEASAVRLNGRWYVFQVDPLDGYRSCLGENGAQVLCISAGCNAPQNGAQHATGGYMVYVYSVTTVRYTTTPSGGRIRRAGVAYQITRRVLKRREVAERKTFLHNSVSTESWTEITRYVVHSAASVAEARAVVKQLG